MCVFHLRGCWEDSLPVSSTSEHHHFCCWTAWWPDTEKKHPSMEETARGYSNGYTADFLQIGKLF